jgi:clan AA aspartic protease
VHRQVISGIVADGHAIVIISFRIPNRTDFPIEFVVDKGFTDELCLPPEAVALLNLPFKYDIHANLADNSQVMLPLHKAIIIWNGEERETRGFATGRRPLVGTALLDNHELVIQFTEGGLVMIDEL